MLQRLCRLCPKNNLFFLKLRKQKKMKGFIELKVLNKVSGYYDGNDYMSTRLVEEIELVNINDIVRVSMGGYVTFKTPYNNGDHSTSTKHTLEEIKELIKQAQS